MTQEPLLTVEDGAREKALRLRARTADPASMALWLGVTGVQRGEWQYDMDLRPLADAGPDDAVAHHDDLAVVVPADSIEALRGARLWLEGDVEFGGIRIDNPNSPSPAVGIPAAGDLEGDVAQRVMQVLQTQINPGIASHGGQAQLVAVEGDTAYLRLAGGCQGCGMASVTLSQGIEVAIRQAVPEIQKVLDVTDHAAGTNPYFEPAKK